MAFNTIFLKSFRILLLPFSCLYGLVIMLRNWMFDRGWFSSVRFNLPVICVGNLSVGGTGKSPLVEYLLRLLHQQHQVATISRGYRRKTKGYVLANEHTTALEIGDEPMQFHLKFPNVKVAVCEQRIIAVPYLLHDHPNLDTIILDDAFQHRAIQGGLNIVLTDFNNLFYHDFFLPTGDLRDEKKSAKRADIILVTKCPLNLSKPQQQAIEQKIKTYTQAAVFFTGIQYGTPYHIAQPQQTKAITSTNEVLLVCGIANPKPIKDYLNQHAASFTCKTYKDHHIFSFNDLKDIQAEFEQMNHEEKMMLTTEKDAVRLTKFNDEWQNLPMYVMPIEPIFLFNQAADFNALVENFIQRHKKDQA